MIKCRQCNGNCDASDLIGGICYDCREENGIVNDSVNKKTDFEHRMMTYHEQTDKKRRAG